MAKSEERSQEVWGEVTEAGAERLRQRVGTARQRGSSMFPGGKVSISQDFIRRAATGIADLNPMYVDPDYAAQSIWGRTLCPPAILAWTEQVNGATDGFPGCHTIWRECELEWVRPIFSGDQIASTTCLTDVELVDSRFSGAAAIQRYETAAEGSDGGVLGYYRTSWHRFSRGGAKGASKYADVQRTQWTDAELEKVWAEYRSQNASRRGPQPLYWEDVSEGTDIPYIIKGPTTLTSKFAFESIGGPGGWLVGHELALELFTRYPGLSIRNEENVPEPPVAIHWTNERCNRFLGMPGAYEAGYERLGWLTQLLMSWMGDHGMLHKLSVRFRGFHWQGDVIRLYGRVREKAERDGRHLVGLDIETITQRGDTTTTGTAEVELPSRAAGLPVWSPR